MWNYENGSKYQKLQNIKQILQCIMIMLLSNTDISEVEFEYYI